jgi:hypothetical protein
MFIFLKLVHMAALIMAGGAMIGSVLLMRQLMANPGPPPPIVRNVMKVLGPLGLVAIILLWLSGIGMAYMKYDGLDIGNWFSAKLVGATIVLVCVVTMSVIAIRAEKAGVPPDMQLMHKISLVSRGGLALALLSAVMQFQ